MLVFNTKRLSYEVHNEQTAINPSAQSPCSPAAAGHFSSSAAPLLFLCSHITGDEHFSSSCSGDVAMISEDFVCSSAQLQRWWRSSGDSLVGIDRQLHAHLPVNIVGGMRLGTSFQSIPRFGFPSQSRGLGVSIFVPYPTGIDSRTFNFVTVVKRALSIKPELKLQAVTNGESLAEDANLCRSFTKFNAIKKRRKSEAARRSSNGALTSSSKQPEESVGSSPLLPSEGEKASNA
ncbi:hypothetical protein AKJ16_DCAP16414, partial [Drosera capensis]